MFNKLNLDEIYPSFNSEDIQFDFNRIKKYILDIETLSNMKINCDVLKEFLYVSNDIILLIDKILAYARLNLYINTHNIQASQLLSNAEKLELKYRKVRNCFSNFLSVELIEQLSIQSEYILEHKSYLLGLLKNNTTVYNYDSNFEKDYNSFISAQQINILSENYPVNLTQFDFFNNIYLLKNKNNYILKRNVIFNNESSFFSSTYNQIKKETIQLASSSGYSSPLEMSLSDSGLSLNIISNLFDAIEKNKDVFNCFLNNNYDLSYDILAFTLPEIKQIIISAFSRFDSSLSDLAISIFDNNYIDLENTKNKIVGSCHLKILALKESRIVGHFYGTVRDIFQIAHELGHAYQNNLIMNSQTPLNSDVPTATCEIISIFCELLVLDSLLKNSQNDEQKKTILHYFIIYCVQAILDVYARFLFEDSTFKLVSNSNISFTKLNSIMIESQKHAYSNSNKFLDKFLWIYKPHFYSVSTPYYNYPYAFGMLYSLLIFNEYKKTNFQNFFMKFKKFCELSACTDISKLSSIFKINLNDSSCYDYSFKILEHLIDNFNNKKRLY